MQTAVKIALDSPILKLNLLALQLSSMRNEKDIAPLERGLELIKAKLTARSLPHSWQWRDFTADEVEIGAKILSILATTYENDGRLPLAIATLDTVIALPGLPSTIQIDTHLQLARLHLKKNARQEAEAHYKAAYHLAAPRSMRQYRISLQYALNCYYDAKAVDDCITRSLPNDDLSI